MCLTKAFDTRRSDLIFKWGGDGDEVNSAGLMIGRWSEPLRLDREAGETDTLVGP